MLTQIENTPDALNRTLLELKRMKDYNELVRRSSQSNLIGIETQHRHRGLRGEVCSQSNLIGIETIPAEAEPDGEMPLNRTLLEWKRANKRI